MALETVSCISSSENDNETCVADPISSHNGCVTIFQANNNLQSNCIKESCINNPTDNVLKILLPLVNENVPLNYQSKVIENDQLLQKQESVASSNTHVQCSPSDYNVDMPLLLSKNINNRNHSLPEDSELNRCSSTFENIKTLLKEGLVDGLDEMPPDFQPPNPPLLYRVSSLPNLLSQDSTKNHHSCSYLTMCATKQELLINKFCKTLVAKHDMSVQVSTELFKNQNEKIFVDTSCQTEDIFVDSQVNTEEPKDHDIFQTNLNIINIEQTKTNKLNKVNEDSSSIGYTYINTFNKEHKLEINAEKDCPSIGYTNINTLNRNYKLKTNSEKDCSSINYTNINVFNTDCEMKTNEEDDCVSYDYTDVNVFNRVLPEVNANKEEDRTSISCTNVNIFNNEEIKNNREDLCSINYTKIITFNKGSEIKSNIKECTDVDYTNMNVVDNINKIDANEHHSLKTVYTNTNVFDEELNVKINGEDCIDMGYSNLNLYDKGLELDSNDDCENYANTNILEEFVNEQLSLNNADGDFDSFLFGPLPPSPIEETGKIIFVIINDYYNLSNKYCIVSELSIKKIGGVETKRENSAPMPFIFDIHKNEPSTSIIKSRSIDAEFSHNFQQHQKIGTRSVSSKHQIFLYHISFLIVFYKI